MQLSMTRSLIFFCLLAYFVHAYPCLNRPSVFFHPPPPPPPPCGGLDIEAVDMWEHEEECEEAKEDPCILPHLPHPPLPSCVENREEEFDLSIDSSHVQEFVFERCECNELWDDMLVGGFIPHRYFDDLYHMETCFEHCCITTWSRTTCQESQYFCPSMFCTLMF
ncbi:hypothetical protein Aperf_G00000110213 [Anoplocephala perfoliata]